jgi:hypothetical protein
MRGVFDHAKINNMPQCEPVSSISGGGGGGGGGAIRGQSRMRVGEE